MSEIGLSKHSKDASYLQVMPDQETFFSHHSLYYCKSFSFANGTIQRTEVWMNFFHKSGHILHLTSSLQFVFLS